MLRFAGLFVRIEDVKVTQTPIEKSGRKIMHAKTAKDFFLRQKDYLYLNC